MDERIRNVLESGPKSPKELKELSMREGVSRSTYHRRLRRLVDRQEVDHVEKDYYQLALRRADTTEVLGYIKDIDESINSRDWEACSSYLKGLSHMCHNFIVTHIPKLLESVREYAEDSDFFVVDNLRSELALLMNSVLNNEIKYGSSKKVDQIEKAWFQAVSKIALCIRSSGLNQVLDFLSNVETKASVDVVIESLCKHNHMSDAELLFHHVLLESNLASVQGRYIREKLVSLTRSRDEGVKTIATQLLAERMSPLRI